MKNKILLLLLTFLVGTSVNAQNALNNAADNIVGTYTGVENGMKYRTKVTKLANGTYKGQMVWLEVTKDEKGNPILDKKNPDKNLRNVPIDKVVFFTGLKYNSKEKRWDGTKIYDPNRGVRANLTAEFLPDGRLHLKGSLLGISGSAYWTKVKE